MIPVYQLTHKIPTEFRRLFEIFCHTSTFLFMYSSIHSEPQKSSVAPWLANTLLVSDM